MSEHLENKVPKDKEFTDITTLERDLSPEEYMSLMNSMTFSTDKFANGVLRDVDEKELQKWLSNPDKYKAKLQKYAFYQYITQSDIFELFDLVRVLPNLNYNIQTITPNKSNITRLQTCRRYLNEINHKELTRDIVSQLISTGTVVGLWVGKEDSKSKEIPYCLLFDDLEYFFPGRRVRGKWTVWCDLSYFCSSSDYRMDVLDNLNPYITMEDVQNFVDKGEDYRYVEFPIERSVCIRTHTLRRNQRFGIPWNTPSLYDVKHKQKLRNLEKVASNKVMNAVAVLTMGLADGESTWKKLGKKLTKSTFDAVKRGLSENKDGEASVVGLPEWGKLSYPDTNVDEVLNPDKINSINDDISHGTVSRGLTTGKDTTYAVAKLNLDIIFNKIGELLENIENEVFNKFLKIVLPNSVAPNFIFEYEKTYPLSATDKLTALQTLATSGYTIKPLIELLGLNFQEYIDQSLYEIEELELREKIKPPLTSYTATGQDVNGNNTNSSTENSKENNDSKSPKPSK